MQGQHSRHQIVVGDPAPPCDDEPPYQSCLDEQQNHPTSVHEQAKPRVSRAIWSGQERVDLRLVEITQARSVIAFERHRPDLAAPGNSFWTTLCDEGCEGVDRCQTLIARLHALRQENVYSLTMLSGWRADKLGPSFVCVLVNIVRPISRPRADGIVAGCDNVISFLSIVGEYLWQPSP